jgi:hypothetical protein
MKKGDAFAWIYIVTSVYLEIRAIKKRDELLKYLEFDSLNPKVHQNFLARLNKLRGLSKGNIELTPVYSRVLEILINNPENPQVVDLVYKTGQWYFKAQEPSKEYRLEDLSQIQNLLIKKQELEMVIKKLKNNSDKHFIEASTWINDLDFSEFADNAVKSKILNLRHEFLDIFSACLLQKMSKEPTNKEFHSLLKSTLEQIKKPNTSYYEDFLLSLLNHTVDDPKNRYLKDFLMYCLDKAPDAVGVSSLKIYNTVLDLFEDSPSQKYLKVLVLDIGRWHFCRKNWLRRSPKPEDEQQMQNDIFMRLKN